MRDSSDFIVEEIPVRRIRKGGWVEKILRLSWHEPTKSLEIAGEWLKTQDRYAEIDLYRVEPIEVQQPGFQGAGYILHRAQSAIDADPNHVKRYETLVGPTAEKSSCSCRGHYKTEHCKHEDALRWLGRKLNPVCEKCGQTDCELTAGLCVDCERLKEDHLQKRQNEIEAEPAPSWLDPAGPYEEYIPF